MSDPFTTVASQIPWKHVIAAAPGVWKTAREIFSSSSKKAESPPVDDPGADVRVQLSALAARVHEIDVSQADQAKLLADMAEQMQAITLQVQALGKRANRLLLLAAGTCVVAVVSLAVAFLR